MVTRFTHVVSASTGVEFGNEVLLGVEALETDAAGVESCWALEVVLPVHLELQHGRQRLSAHYALHGCPLQNITPKVYFYLARCEIYTQMHYFVLIMQKETLLKNFLGFPTNLKSMLLSMRVELLFVLHGNLTHNTHVALDDLAVR